MTPRIAPALPSSASHRKEEEEKGDSSLISLIEEEISYDREEDGPLYSLSEEHRLKLREAARGRPPVRLSTREKIAEANRRRGRRSEATKLKARLSQLGRPKSPEARERMRLAKLGTKRTVSEETRRKLSERAGARRYSPEARRKQSLAARLREERGRTREHLRRQSESAKRLWRDDGYRARALEARRQRVGGSPSTSS